MFTESEGWYQNMRVKIVALCVLALCLLVGVACAEEVHDVAYDRVDFQITEGVVATKSGTDGNVVLTIDVEHTDWEKVAVNGGLDVRVSVQAPDATPDGKAITGHYGVCFGPNSTLQDRMNVLHSEMAYDYLSAAQRVYTNGMGTGVESGMIFRPETSQDVTLLCWGDPRGNSAYKAISDKSTANARYYEQLYLQVQFTNDELIYLPMHNARVEWLEPVRMYYGEDMVQEILSRHGQLDLYLIDRSKVADSDLNSPFVLRLAAPANAEKLQITTWSGEEYSVPVQNGIAEFVDDRLILYRWNSDNDTVSTGKYTLQWQTPWDAVVAYGELVVNVIPAEHELCAFYQKSLLGVPMQPVPEDRIQVDNQAENCGIVVEKANGFVRYTHDGNTVASGDPGDVTIRVEPHDDYAYFRLGGAGGSDVYGHAESRIMMMYEDAMLKPYQKASSNLINVTGTTPLIAYQAGPMKVYLQNSEIMDWMNAGVNLILWYETEEQALTGKPSLIEFVAEEETKFMIPIRLDLVNHEHHITKPVKNVTIIKPLGREWKDWKLNVRIDPQRGTNAWHYELYLESDTDALRHIALPKDQPLVVYMPYPEGYSANSKEQFEVYHFENAEGVYKTLEVLKAEKTPFGIRFEVTSLSPFVLSVASENPPAAALPENLPQTGDSTPLTAWMLLAAASTIGVWLFLKKREA